MKYNGSGWGKQKHFFSIGVSVYRNPYASRRINVGDKGRVVFCIDYRIEIWLLCFRYQINVYNIRKLRKLP